MNKKISLFIIIFGMVMGPQLTQPKQALGLGGPVTEIGPNVATNISSTSWDKIRDDVLKPAIKKIASKALGKLTKDTLGWINNGFDGDPGFVNNWDDFLKGTEHEVILGAFTAASIAATKTQTLADQKNQESIDQCLLTEKITKLPEEKCDDQFLVRYERCIQPENDLESFDGENFELCNESLEADKFTYELCLETNLTNKQEYEKAIAKCNSLQSSQTGNTVGNIALQNYKLYQSGELNTKRAVATVIANSGAQQLHQDALNSLIEGGGETLTTLLGSQGAKDAFKNDITVGGWEGYLALADPHNYDAGLQSLVNGALTEKTTSKVSRVIQDIQTPVKLFDKKECLERSKTEKDANGEFKCLKEKVITPGGQVAAKLNETLVSEENKAGFFSDALVGPLLGALGDLTDGLIESGISQLTGAATNALFNSQESRNTFNGDYQSQYDVLGIQSNSSNSTINSATGSSTSGGGSVGSIFGNDADTSFIGGPEDREGVAWDQGPQVVIDLKESLELNIKLAEEELFNYEKSNEVLRSSKNTAINLDRCLPGPDYGWEERYKDVFNLGNNEKDKLGFIETEEMTKDPRVNIPGSSQILNIFQQLVGGNQSEKIQVKSRLDSLENLLINLKFIKQTTNEQFNTYRSDLGMNNLVLFIEDWDKLNDGNKENAAGNAIDGFLKTNDSTSSSYLILKEGETIESALTSTPEKVRDAVIDMSWDIWRNKTPKVGDLGKEELRYSYYVQQNNLSNNEFIALAKSTLNRIKSGAIESEKILSDCLILKAYAVGKPISEIRQAIAESEKNTPSLEGNNSLNNILLRLNPYFSPGVGFVRGSDYTFIEIPEPIRTNKDIKDFLQNEYLKTQDNDPNTESLFLTNSITNPEAISNSILGFDTSEYETVSIQITKVDPESNDLPEFEDQELPQNEAYFQRKYPDFEFNDVQKNSYEISDIFRKDRFFTSFNRAFGERGILFCRNARIGDLHSGHKNLYEPVCIFGEWYHSSNLDYELLFSGVSL